MLLTTWFSLVIFVLAYTWAGYLILILIASLFSPSRVLSFKTQPFLTVLVTVKNEESVIQNRILNIFNSDYPAHLLEILVASDGSTDRTNDIVEDMRKLDNRIRLLKTSGGGKSQTQNQAIPQASGEIVVLTDAETVFIPNTLPSLTKPFNDPKVGCVSGSLVLQSTNAKTGISESQGLYWKFEMLLRKTESKIGLFHTATGCIMAFRANLFRPFEPTYGDDCIIPLDILEQGYRVVHQENAMAYDAFPATIQGELRARIRMTLRNITCTLSKYELLKIWKNPMFFFAITSHKLLRWLTPFFLILAFFLNVFLINENKIYLFTFLLQISFYLLGLAGLLAEKMNFRIPLASSVFGFLLANTGFFFGVLKAITRQKIRNYK